MPPRHKLYLLPPLSLIPKPLAELALLAHWHMSFLSHMCGFRGGGAVVVVVVVIVSATTSEIVVGMRTRQS